jgi:hypothetical protein
VPQFIVPPQPLSATRLKSADSHLVKPRIRSAEDPIRQLCGWLEGRNAFGILMLVSCHGEARRFDHLPYSRNRNESQDLA